MVRISEKFKAAGLAMALLMPAAIVPVVSHAQQTDTAPAKAKAKKKARKSTAPAITPSPAEGTTQRNPTATPDPINPSSSPEPPVPTTQGPPPAPTTPSTNSPQAAPQNAPH